MEINKEHFLYSLLVIKQSKILRQQFEKDNKISFNHDLIKASFEANLLKENIIFSIQSIGGICFEINGKIFLEGEKKSGFDYVGDKCSDDKAIELYDMTTEMLNGHSYTFYVSTTSYFALATVEDTIKVNEFLKTLK